jgi:hypothetical protein
VGKKPTEIVCANCILVKKRSRRGDLKIRILGLRVCGCDTAEPGGEAKIEFSRARAPISTPL